MNLTREEILKLGAGPEMDAALAEFVMGWRPEHICQESIDEGESGDALLCVWVGRLPENCGNAAAGIQWEDCPLKAISTIPPYSTCWNAMREVIKKVLADIPERHKYVALEYDEAENEWKCTFPHPGKGRFIRGYAETLPVAVGRTALLRELEKEGKTDET